MASKKKPANARAADAGKPETDTPGTGQESEAVTTEEGISETASDAPRESAATGGPDAGAGGEPATSGEPAEHADTADPATARPQDPADDDRTAADMPEERHRQVVRTEQVVVRQGGFWSMLLGGIATAGIGVLAAPHILPANLFPQADTGLEARVSDALATQDSRIGDLRALIEGLPVPPDPEDAIAGLSETVTAISGQIAAIESRLSELENRPAPETAPGVTAAEIETLRAEVAALRADAEAVEAAARDDAMATLRRAALTRILTALDSGSDFASALADLRDTGVEVPAALDDAAASGVPTQAALAESFPDAARAALAAARTVQDDAAAGLGAFLKSQLGVRSLSPREGDDADAILSRAEAALAGGRLGDALAELETLPEAARAPMEDWKVQARQRKAALDAAEALAGTLN